MVTDGTGKVTQTSRAGAFGQVTAAGVAASSRSASREEATDPESGLVFPRARTYSPALGRFMQRDLAGGAWADPLSLNRYSYFDNNPASATDPSGLCADPGGPGLRYCIERFIPTAYANVGFGYGVFRGDNRGPSAGSGRRLRIRQFVDQLPNGATVGHQAEVSDRRDRPRRDCRSWPFL